MPEQIAACDVLVLGSGLAGLRAAWAACEAVPGSRVMVASPLAGPSGSALANRNARLGMLTPHSDARRDALLARILDLAAPGVADPALARLLLEEAAPRAAELEALGAPLERTPDGQPQRHTACFAKDHACAVQFIDLPGTHALLSAKAETLGATFLPALVSWRVLTGQDGTACGAALTRLGDGNTVTVRAGAVVAALGGPAPLFARSMAGPGCYGLSYGLLQEAGAALANTGFTQFFWTTLQDGAFFRAHTLAEPGAAVAQGDGTMAPLPPHIACHASERATHCPAAWGRPDAALDRFLAARLNDQGALDVRMADGTELRIGPAAHSGNGGAVIDAHGATSVPGLFAAGECATGMHGADRVGGAMSAAALVFGARAGATAARHAAGADRISDKLFSELMELPPSVPFFPPQPPQGIPAPIPAAALGKCLALSRYDLTLIEQNIILSLFEPASALHRTSLISALTVVRDLHRIG